MAKIKLENISGIITNYNNTLLKPEVAVEGANIFIGNGYIEDDTPTVKAYYEDDNYIGDGSEYLPYLDEGWEWETGIFANIGQDFLSENKEVFNNLFLFLVAKYNDNGTYKRTIWYRKWSESAEDAWQQPFGLAQATEDMLATTIDGEVHFSNANGVLKLYFPHDSFWFGYLERTLYIPSNGLKKPITATGYFFDRLVENSDFANNIPVSSRDDIVCHEEYRTGIKLTTEALDQTDTVITEETKFKFKYKRHEYHDKGNGDLEKEFVVCEAEITEGSRKGELLESPYLEGWYGAKTTEWYFARVSYRTYLDGQTSIPYTTDKTVRWYDAYMVPIDFIKNVSVTGSDWGETLQLWASSIKLNWAGHTIEQPYDKVYILDTYRYVPQETGKYSRTTMNYSPSTETIEAEGFEKTSDKVLMAGSVVIDETTEVMAAFKEIDISGISTEKFGIRLQASLPSDINRRVTRVRIYIKQKNIDADFALAYEYDLLDEKSSTTITTVIKRGDVTEKGTTLSQNIAYYLDEDKLSDYFLVRGVSTISEIDGISLALASGDYYNVYYSVLGGGNLQPDVIYRANRLPISFKDKLTAIASINNNFGVFGTNRLSIIKPDISGTSLIFSAIDAAELGAKNKNDVAEVQGGTIVNSPLGIFLTNGYNKQWLSEPVNSQVKLNYENSYILWDPYLQELLLLYNGTTVEYWKYNFEYQNWMYYKVGPAIIIKPILSPNGGVSFLVRDPE